MNQRRLVGMSMGARKRAARNEDDYTRSAEYLFQRTKYRIGQRLRPCPGCAQCLRCLCGNSAACIGLYEAWTKHQKAEPACNDCCGHGCEDGHCDKVDDICDGSGVLPARAKKVRR